MEEKTPALCSLFLLGLLVKAIPPPYYWGYKTKVEFY